MCCIATPRCSDVRKQKNFVKMRTKNLICFCKMRNGWWNEDCKPSVCCDFKERGRMGWLKAENLKLRGLMGEGV